MIVIVYDNENDAIELNGKIHNALMAKKDEIGYNADFFSNLKYHPSNGKVACLVNKQRKPLWNKEIFSVLTQEEMSLITILTPDWYVNPEL